MKLPSCAKVLKSSILGHLADKSTDSNLTFFFLELSPGPPFDLFLGVMDAI